MTTPQLFLFMKHGNKVYVSAVLFADGSFCAQVGALLKNYYGHRLEEIGSLDLADLL